MSTADFKSNIHARLIVPPFTFGQHQKQQVVLPVQVDDIRQVLQEIRSRLIVTDDTASTASGGVDTLLASTLVVAPGGDVAGVGPTGVELADLLPLQWSLAGTTLTITFRPDLLSVITAAGIVQANDLLNVWDADASASKRITVAQLLLLVPAGVASLTDLTDVDISASAIGHALIHDGTSYKNRLIVEADISDLGAYITGVAWGDITGTIATQTDLLAELDAIDAAIAAVASDLSGHEAATAVHGATGAVVGTTNTQTLSSKTLTSPIIGNFTNATHGHTAASSGGLLNAGAIFSSGTQVPLEHGGTESDLSATGPGVLKQASAGAAVTVAAISAADFSVISLATWAPWNMDPPIITGAVTDFTVVNSGDRKAQGFSLNDRCDLLLDPVPAHYSGGGTLKLRLTGCADTTTAADRAKFEITTEPRTPAAAETMGTDAFDATPDSGEMPFSTTAYSAETVQITLTPAVALVAGDAVRIRIKRVDSSDELTGDCLITGAELTWEPA